MGANSITTVRQRGAVGSSSAIATSDGTVLAANDRRLWWAVINLDDAAVYVKMGAGATTSDFHFPLQACTAADDGKGGTIFDDTYAGIVSIKAATGSPRVSVIEMLKSYGAGEG